LFLRNRLAAGGTLRRVTWELPDLREVNLDGPVAYRTWDGPPDTTFVLVHGLGGSHLNWVQVAPGLAGLGRVLALDLPGFGWSPLAGRDAGVMDLRRTLAQFIAELGSGEVIVCGNSMGGAVGILQAAVEPESLAGLVLTASVFPWVRGAFPHAAVIGAFALYDTPGIGERVVGARMRRWDPERVVRVALWLTTADASTIPDEVVRLNVELVSERRNDPDGPRAFVESARSLLRLGRRPDIARRALDAITCPVLVVHGRRDRLVPAAVANATLSRYPAWRGRLLPNVGHVPQMEAPGRWLAEVADWYASFGDA
jgi:pimeloyl-ACP methyl ester carboxylesterase